MMTARASMLAFCCIVSMFAQSARPKSTGVHKPSLGKPAAEAPSAPDRPDLEPAIADLRRITTATTSDIDDLQIDKWKSGWKTAWRKGGEHKQEAQQMAASIRRNLGDAMPSLITEVQSSHGSVSSAFKLYNDLSVVVESLDSLIAMTRTYGRKGESGPLANDDAALGRLRQDISSYIQTTAAALEPKPKAPGPASTASGTPLKKAVIEDEVPVKKKTAASTH